MTSDQITLEKHLKKATVWANTLSVIFALVASLSVGMGFITIQNLHFSNTLQTSKK